MAIRSRRRRPPGEARHANQNTRPHTRMMPATVASVGKAREMSISSSVAPGSPQSKSRNISSNIGTTKSISSAMIATARTHTVAG